VDGCIHGQVESLYVRGKVTAGLTIRIIRRSPRATKLRGGKKLNE
jgi:hypothetical protein